MYKIRNHFPSFKDLTLFVYDPELVKNILKNSIEFSYRGDAISRVDAKEEIMNWIQSNKTGMVFIQDMSGLNQFQFKIGFEKDQDMVMFCIKFKGAK